MQHLCNLIKFKNRFRNNISYSVLTSKMGVDTSPSLLVKSIVNSFLERIVRCLGGRSCFKQEHLYRPSFLYFLSGILHISNMADTVLDRFLVCLPVVETNNTMITSIYGP